MKQRKILSLLLTLSLIISLCAAFSVSASAATTCTKSLWLSDAVSDANADEGWTWDADTATLTLDSVAIETDEHVAIFIAGDSGSSVNATIVLKGENSISTKGMHAESDTCHAIYVEGSCTIIGDADSSLNIRTADSDRDSSYSVGILTGGDLTFNSKGQITVISGNAALGAAVISCGNLTFASGSISMSGITNACQADNEILVADDLAVKGAADYMVTDIADYMAVNGADVAVIIFDDGISSFVVDDVDAKTICVSAK